MKNSFNSLIILALISSLCIQASAQSTMGGEVFYFHEPTVLAPYRFKVVFQLYRYCVNTPAPISVQLNLKADTISCVASSTTLTLDTVMFYPKLPFPLRSRDQLHTLNNGATSNCSSGNFSLPANQIFNYVGFVNIPASCRRKWFFIISGFSRPPSVNINSSASTAAYVAMVDLSLISPVDISNGLRTNSVYFLNPPTTRTNVNALFEQSMGGVAGQFEDDSISYELKQPFSSISLDTIQYLGAGTNNNANSIQPIPSIYSLPSDSLRGLHIDPYTGNMIFRPIGLGFNFNYVVECTRWRRFNNQMVKAGYTRRDMYLSVASPQFGPIPNISKSNGMYRKANQPILKDDFKNFSIRVPVCKQTCFTIRGKSIDDSIAILLNDTLLNFLNITTTSFNDSYDPVIKVCLNPDPVAFRSNPYFLNSVVYDWKDFSGRASATYAVYVTPGDFADAGPDFSTCNGVGLLYATGGGVGASYQWTPSTGLSDSISQFPIFTATDSSTRTFVVYVQNSNGCISYDTVRVKGNFTTNVSVSIMGGKDTVVSCSGQPVQLFAEGTEVYNWIPALNMSDPFVYNPVVSPSTTTTYYVIGSNSSCLSTPTDSVVVLIDTFILSAQPDTTICRGDTVSLIANSSSQVQWNILSPHQANQFNSTSCCTQVAPTISSTFIAKTSTPNGCILYDTIFIGVNLNTIPLVQSGDTLIATLTGANYQWFLNGTKIIGATSNFIVPIQSGNYSVQLSNAQGCLGESLPFNFTVSGLGVNSIATEQVEIYPNPVHETLQIKVSKPFIFTVHTVHGVLVAQGTSTEPEMLLNTAAYRSGTYLLRVITDEGSTVQKFVKE